MDLKLTTIISATLLVAACHTGKNNTAGTDTTETAGTTTTTAANTLSRQEQAEGWVLLFDGTSLDGWRTYQNKDATSWVAEGGTLHCKGSTTDKSDLRADLVTSRQYENFDLSLDWKLAPQGNSGIMYRVTETEKAAYLTGPEYQLIDDDNFPEKLEDWQKTGANYAMNPAPAAKPKPVGEWNHTRIVVNKGHVEHWLNGEKVVEYQLGSDEWKQARATGKWKDAPSYGTSPKGHIALQDHGSEAWFRNIKIREL